MRTLVAGLALVALAGCATPPSGLDLVTQGQADLDAANVCCETMATAARLPLPLQKTPISLDKTRQAFSFGGTKAFFVLFELPAYTRPYGLTVSSVPGGTPGDVALVVPKLAFYDADFRPTRHFDEKTLRNRGTSVERTVFVNPQDAGERYLAVFASDLSASIERAYSEVTVTPVAAGPVVFNLYGGRDGKSTLRSSPTGVFEIETQGLVTPPPAR